MSGSCPTGIRVRDSSPARVAMMAMTSARRGRSINVEGIMVSGPPGRRRCRRRRNNRVGPHALNALYDDTLPLLEALSPRRRLRSGLVGKFHPPLLGNIAVIDDVQVVTLLVG